MSSRSWLAVALFVVSIGSVAQAQRKNAPTSTSAPTPADDPQLYRNSTYGFRYQIPYGWVDRTKQMLEGNDAGKAEVLLAIFERPPDASGDTINSAVVIVSEPTTSYPGLKRAEDFVGPLSELATAKGFKPDGDPYPLEVESRHLLRADFRKQISAGTNELTMRQSTLVSLIQGQIVSFTFIAGTEDELDELMDALHFAPAKAATKPHP